MVAFVWRATLLTAVFAAFMALLIAGVASGRMPPAPVDQSALQIVFESRLDARYGAYVMNHDGSSIANLTLADQPVFKPVCSANGMHLAFSAGKQLYTLSVADDTLTPVEYPVGGVIGLSLSGDGNWLALNVVDELGSFALDLLDLRSATRRRLLESRTRIGAITLSPDGGRLLFEQLAGGGLPHLAEISVSAPTAPRRVAAGGFPAWSPDGQVIVYSLGHDLQLLDVDAARSAPLAHLGTGLYNPAWSPDGRAIAFWTYLAGTQIRVMDADGHGLHGLADSGIGFAPCFLLQRPRALVAAQAS